VVRRIRRGRPRDEAGASASGRGRRSLDRGLALSGEPGPVRRAYLGLGSNIGERLEHLLSAVSGLDATDGVRVLRCSSVYETEPVGEVTVQRDFYNAVIEVETTLEPHDLLARCKHVERELGRDPGGPRHGPRTIDVDVLLVGDLMTSDERLVLPHPEVTQRRFVLVPLLELDPNLALPDGTPLATALAGLPPGQRALQLGPLARPDPAPPPAPS
jgi:2-amino-4-hydroxy-6-hydroxymethyldihydropteridine diphosphokinase